MQKIAIFPTLLQSRERQLTALILGYRNYYYYYYYNHFTTLCPVLPEPIVDFAEAEMMGWHWHQLDHMQAICTSLQKVTMPAPHQSDFYGLDALPDSQPTASKH